MARSRSVFARMGGFGMMGHNGGPAISVSYDADATALFARMSVQPTDDRKAKINAFILALKAGGIWAKSDCIYLLAAHDAQAARLNLKSTSFNLTAVNNPSFAIDQGYTGNGSNAYLATGFNPSTAGGAFVRDSASLGAWCTTNSATAGYAIGGGNSGLAPRATAANNMRGTINHSTSHQNFGNNLSSVGLSVLSRTTSNLTTSYFNGAANGTSSNVSQAPENNAINVAALGASATSHQIAFAFIGAGLSAAENLALYNAVNTYLTGILVPDTTAPTISSGNPSGAYNEGISIGGTLTANENVTWTVTGTDAARVTLNQFTGVWTLEATDYETRASYSFTFVALDGSNNTSQQVVAITINDLDEVAPTLSSPTDAANGATGYTGTVSTTDANGTLYRVVSTSSTPPTNVQVKAGQDHTGASAAASGSQAVVSSGVQNVSGSGLTFSTAYTIHYAHEDAAGNLSTVSSADGFTTSALPTWTGASRAGSPLQTDTATSDVLSITPVLAPHDVGDLLLVIICIDGNASITAPAGWSPIYNGTNSTNCRLAAYVADAKAASDAEANPVFTIGAAQQGSAFAYSIPGGDPAKVAVGAGFTGASTAPDAPAVTSGVTADHLFIAFCGADNNSSVSVTAYPTGYTNADYGWNGSVNSALVGVCEKSTTASTSDNPSAFTLSGSEQWVANSIALWP